MSIFNRLIGKESPKPVKKAPKTYDPNDLDNDPDVIRMIAEGPGLGSGVPLHESYQNLQRIERDIKRNIADMEEFLKTRPN